jgi:hypothetical protein
MANSINTAMANANRELVPWVVVFLVLFAVVFSCSCVFTLYDDISNLPKKPLKLVSSDEGKDDLAYRNILADESGVQLRERLPWTANETQRPIDFLYSKSDQTRLLY